METFLTNSVPIKPCLPSHYLSTNSIINRPSELPLVRKRKRHTTLTSAEHKTFPWRSPKGTEHIGKPRTSIFTRQGSLRSTKSRKT